MTYLSAVVHRRPMLRTVAAIILTFSVAVPLVWIVSNFFVYELIGQ